MNYDINLLHHQISQVLPVDFPAQGNPSEAWKPWSPRENRPVVSGNWDPMGGSGVVVAILTFEAIRELDSRHVGYWKSLSIMWGHLNFKARLSFLKVSWKSSLISLYLPIKHHETLISYWSCSDPWTVSGVQKNGCRSDDPGWFGPECQRDWYKRTECPFVFPNLIRTWRSDCFTKKNPKYIKGLSFTVAYKGVKT